MKTLIVLDMQEEYVGRSRKDCPYDTGALLQNINARIAGFTQAGDPVVYVRNIRRVHSTPVSPLVEGLAVAAQSVFHKESPSCFSNRALAFLLRESGADLEICGVDGNHSVAASALEGAKAGLSVTLPLDCVGAANLKRFEKTKAKLEKAGVVLL